MEGDLGMHRDLWGYAGSKISCKLVKFSGPYPTSP